MRCAQCQTEIPVTARFCPGCGEAIPASTGINVDQQVGMVKGEVVGTILDNLTSAPGLSSSTKQKVDTVERIQRK